MASSNSVNGRPPNLPVRTLQAWAARLSASPGEFGSWYVAQAINVLAGGSTDMRTLSPGVRWELLDGRYWTVDLLTLERIVRRDWTSRYRWLKSRRDCDDFSFYFKARLSEWFGITGVGIVMDRDTHHTYNLVVLDRRDSEQPLGAVLLEPQSGKVVAKGDELYRFENAEVLI